MDKKILLIILIVGALFLSGCNLRPMSCSNDGVCSLDEEIIGTCYDCMPDFVVDDEDMYVSYNPDTHTIDASTCIKNTGGNFEGDIEVGWQVSSQRDYQSDYKTETVYFNGPSAESHAYITVKNHQIIFNNEVRIGKQDQYYCVSKRFENIQPASQYWIHIQVSSPDVEEKNVDNNWASTSIAGVQESYPEYLIESNLGNNGEFQYINSRYMEDDEDGYLLRIYTAFYDSYEVSNAVFDSPQLAREYLEQALSETSDIQIIYDGRVYLVEYDEGSNYALFAWTSGSSIIIVYRGDVSISNYPIENDPVLLSYILRFPSDSQGICGDGIVNVMEQCDGEDLRSVTCSMINGYTGGTLTCYPPGTNNECMYDTTQCDHGTGYCGDGIINNYFMEECDGYNWGDIISCQDLGFEGGTLACTDCQFDTIQCTSYYGVCGDDILNAGEDCEPTRPLVVSCTDFDSFTGGSLLCTSDCTYDVSNCVVG